MSAVDAVDTQRAKAPLRPAANSVTADFAWRVLVLLNLFRLSVGAVLLAVFYLVDAPRIVGETDDTLAWRALIGLLTAGCVFLVLLQKRTPSARVADLFAVRHRPRGRRPADSRERRSRAAWAAC